MKSRSIGGVAADADRVAPFAAAGARPAVDAAELEAIAAAAATDAAGTFEDAFCVALESTCPATVSVAVVVVVRGAGGGASNSSSNDRDVL
jgi:hypothetical protein